MLRGHSAAVIRDALLDAHGRGYMEGLDLVAEVRERGGAASGKVGDCDQAGLDRLAIWVDGLSRPAA